MSTAALATPTSAQPAGGCVVTYQLVGQWPGGFQSQVTVTNVSDTTASGWEVTLEFPDGYQIRPPWGYGIPPFPGDPVRIRNAPWNGTLPPNASSTFGIIGTYPGGMLQPPVITCTLI